MATNNAKPTHSVFLQCNREESRAVRESLVRQSRWTAMRWWLVLSLSGCGFAFLAAFYQRWIGVEWSAASSFGFRILLVVGFLSLVGLAFCWLRGWRVRRLLGSSELTLRMSEKRIEIEDYFIDFKFWNQRPVVTWLPGSSETILRFELRRASWSIQHGTLRSRKLVSIPLPQHTADQHDSLERLYSLDQHSSVKNVADGQEDEPAIDASDHRCPGCDCALKYSQRYPDYFCMDCLSLAEDADGRRLQFGNMGPMGGFYWSLDGALDGESETTHENSDPVKCLISGRQAIVVEARFGGVVAQPVDSKGGASWVKGKLVDLTRKSP